MTRSLRSPRPISTAAADMLDLLLTSVWMRSTGHVLPEPLAGPTAPLGTSGDRRGRASPGRPVGGPAAGPSSLGAGRVAWAERCPRVRKRPPRWEHAVACGSSPGVEMIFGSIHSRASRAEALRAPWHLRLGCRTPVGVTLHALRNYIPRANLGQVRGPDVPHIFRPVRRRCGAIYCTHFWSFEGQPSTKTTPPSRHRPR
jgi:hypothetical protein